MVLCGEIACGSLAGPIQRTASIWTSARLPKKWRGVYPVSQPGLGTGALVGKVFRETGSVPQTLPWRGNASSQESRRSTSAIWSFAWVVLTHPPTILAHRATHDVTQGSVSQSASCGAPAPPELFPPAAMPLPTRKAHSARIWLSRNRCGQRLEARAGGCGSGSRDSSSGGSVPRAASGCRAVVRTGLWEEARCRAPAREWQPASPAFCPSSPVGLSPHPQGGVRLPHLQAPVAGVVRTTSLQVLTSAAYTSASSDVVPRPRQSRSTSSSGSSQARSPRQLPVQPGRLDALRSLPMLVARQPGPERSTRGWLSGQRRILARGWETCDTPWLPAPLISGSQCVREPLRSLLQIPKPVEKRAGQVGARGGPARRRGGPAELHAAESRRLGAVRSGSGPREQAQLQSLCLAQRSGRPVPRRPLRALLSLSMPRAPALPTERASRR